MKKLVGVTKKLPSGGLHTKFHGSSASSPSSDSSSESSSSSSHPPQRARGNNKAPSKHETQWDVKKPTAPFKTPPPKTAITPTTTKPGVPRKTAALQPAKSPAGARGTDGVPVAKPAKARARRRKARKGKSVAGAVVGGPGDVLTTKSLLYTSPVGKVSNVTVTDVTPAVRDRNKKVTGGEGLVHGEQGEEGGGDVEGVGAGGTNSREEEEGRGVEGNTEDSAGHARPSGHSALSASLAESSSSVEATRDYSGFAALQGLPRVGDRLAFKVIVALIP